MAKMLWLNWSGGGNLPPSLGIARVLAHRGHRVSFAGRPEMVPRVERAGLRAIELRRAYEQADSYPQNKWIPKAACFLTSPAVASEIAGLLASEAPDVVIVDQMFPVAHLETFRYGRPSVSICHTSVWRMLDIWRSFFSVLGELRTEAGFEPIPRDLETLWMGHDRMIVTTLKSLDEAPGELGRSDKLRFVGPALEQERHGVVARLPWGDRDSRPLALVSFSTAPEQGSVAKFQSAIDALAHLPVRTVVTVGDSIDPAGLTPAENTAIFANVDHDELMPKVSVLLTHGGHGTLMRALRRGLPMVVVPGLAADQVPNAEAVQKWGVGRSLPPNADALQIRLATTEVLSEKAYRQRAAQIAEDLSRVDGCSGAADEIEALLPN